MTTVADLIPALTPNRPATALEWIVRRCYPKGHELIRPVAQFKPRCDFVAMNERGCWLWRGATTQENGYGHVQVRTIHGRHDVVAHRLTFALTKCPSLELTPGYDAQENMIDHDPACPKTCINPDHLDLVTRRENILRGRSSALKEFRGSTYAGVKWDRQSKKWRADIKVGGASVFLGLYASEDTAAAAYDAALDVMHEQPANASRGLLVRPSMELLRAVAQRMELAS